MNGISFRHYRVGFAIAAACLLGLLLDARADEGSLATKPAKAITEPIDPFIDEDKAKDTLSRFWEYSADYAVEPKALRAPSGFLDPNGERGWPFEAQSDAQSVDTAAPAVRKMSSLVRLDLRTKSKFRIEILLTDHSNRACNYSFGEGTWKLRGRLLVLTFLLENELERWGFFVEKLAGDEVVVMGIDDSVELFRNGRGVLTKQENPRPLSIPRDYAVKVDEVSYGSATADIAEYLRDNLDIEVDITKGR